MSYQSVSLVSCLPLQSKQGLMPSCCLPCSLCYVTTKHNDLLLAIFSTNLNKHVLFMCLVSRGRWPAKKSKHSGREQTRRWANIMVRHSAVDPRWINSRQTCSQSPDRRCQRCVLSSARHPAVSIWGIQSLYLCSFIWRLSSTALMNCSMITLNGLIHCTGNKTHNESFLLTVLYPVA